MGSNRPRVNIKAHKLTNEKGAFVQQDKLKF